MMRGCLVNNLRGPTWKLLYLVRRNRDVGLSKMMILFDGHTSDIRILPLASDPQCVGRANDRFEPILVRFLFEESDKWLV